MAKKKGVGFLECAEDVKELLESSGFEVGSMDKFGNHVQCLLKKKGSSVGYLRFYQSKDGTTIDGSPLKESAQAEVEEVLKDYAEFKEKSRAADVQGFDVIGTDESGKGDYFGPLVVAGVFVPDEEARDALVKLGVADSKKVSDAKVARLVDDIKRLCPHSIVKLPPPTYNRLYSSFGNLNKLLAWCHAKAVEDLLEDGVEPFAVVSDKFGDRSLLEDELGEQDFDIVQEVRGEENVAVAAASILARGEFLMRLSGLSMNYGVELPLGAGDDVVEKGKEFVEKHSVDELSEVAKLHFRTTDKIK